MGYRKCPNHGWIETYYYEPRLISLGHDMNDGELVCKECGEIVTGFKQDGGLIKNLPRA